MHELLCCLRLLQTSNLPIEIKEHLHQKLAHFINETVAFDPALWKGYSLRPLQGMDNPASPFLVGHEQSVEANFAYEISSQTESGSWTPAWSWGDASPGEWPLASQDWTGVITLDKLLPLKSFKRIEGIL
jgi:hypothetical protein